ncbi:MAG: sigma-54-dependent Fis family transcriptional regulator [Calditrichaeota bacterium]|nr:sigma-54-dependent Fis family transcriptional regulator [Calditrichota bacterium]MCB0269187.1 sigma-54-dependent Fis family transcriptional regulator [Calditrichota bacterium]
MQKAATLLIVDDEPNIHYSFEKILPDDIRIVSAHSAEEGISKLRTEQPDVVVMDVRMPGMDGLEALQKMRAVDGKVPVIMMTAFGTVNTAITAMKFGAFEYLLKPFDVKKMRQVIEKAVETSLRMRRVVQIPSDVAGGDGDGDMIVGSSEAMQDVYKLIGQVAEQNVTVLIRGESGTGKELVARAIYHHSRRSEKPFLEVNCAALPESLLESELFGYEKGAFTGANERKIGKFEQVKGGTLFLDEIGEMSLMTQAKVLRVIQYGDFTRVGGNEIVRSDVRLIVATNRILEEAIKQGKFREDLYYRLNVITIAIPPLRERREDVSDLVQYFIKKYSKEANKNIRGIDKKALKELVEYPWPGNVRQLENCIRRAVVLSKGFTISPEDLELETEFETTVEKQDVWEVLEKLLDEVIANRSDAQLWPVMEQLLIEKVLKKTRGNQVQAARILGIHRNTLRNRIERYGLGRNQWDD